MTAVATEARCPYCDGAGYYKEAVPFGHPNFSRALPCVCKLEQRAQREKAATHSRLLQLSSLAGRFASATLDSFEVATRPYPGPVEWYDLARLDRRMRWYAPDMQRQSLRAAVDLARAFLATPRGGLLFQGPYGSGKTHLAYAVAHALLERGHTLAADSLPALLEFIKAGFEDDSASRRIQDLKTVDVLLLDDVGTERATDWSAEQVYNIINHRYVFDLWTIFTSNVPLVYFTGRIGSRIAEFAQVASVIAYDMRLLRGQRSAS